MNIDARTTKELFKGESFWNAYGFFMTHDHAQFLKEAVVSHLNQHLLEAKKIGDFENRLNENIQYLGKRLASKKDKGLDKEIGEKTNGININQNILYFDLVDLDNEAVLDTLLEYQELSNRNREILFHRIVSLYTMVEEMEKTLNDGVERLRINEEIDRVKELLFNHFEYNHISEVITERKKDSFKQEEMDNLLKESVAIANELDDRGYEQGLQFIFEKIEKEKNKETE